MSKIITPEKFDKRAKISRLAAWSLVVVTVFTVFALMLAFFVFSSSNPTNQSGLNTISTEESTSTSTEENSSTNTSTDTGTGIAPTTSLTSNEPVKITPIFWSMLVIFLSLLFVGLRHLANRR
jgi:Na+/H+-dicarboxylate symporter